MNFFNYFRSRKGRSAQVAKERLQVIVARERVHRDGPDYLPRLQEEILNVIRKYVQVDEEAVSIQIERDGDCEVLELNVTLPEHRA
ncbi:cell division topological specificity factor MinE [Thioalkalivibrio thiocyanodenitrificans]|uniref:cell division topological specificity factor MinE n=1 Tax=Thioalkalivibrio thiocyanodenitrificans TaxID=243063 RepID=UPI00047684BA|nr:cell division topological specificity factor MinE [Thioalkalivibrio thiocyanodenitrificans]